MWLTFIFRDRDEPDRGPDEKLDRFVWAGWRIVFWVAVLFAVTGALAIAGLVPAR